jgi:hypothetical protein
VGKLVQDKQGDAVTDAAHPASEQPAGCWPAFLNFIADFRAAFNIRRQAIDKDQQGELTPKVIVVLVWPPDPSSDVEGGAGKMKGEKHTLMNVTIVACLSLITLPADFA